MASSATGIPDVAVDTREPGVGEEEPLLGRAGDASQPEGKALYYNLLIG
jgi:Eukaryotic cytochrome b561